MACAEFIIKQRLICFHSINSVFNILGSSISTEGRRRKPSPFSHCFSSAGCALWVGDFRLPALCAMTWLHAKLCSILAHVQYQQASRSKWRKQKLNHYSMFLVYKERYCPPTQSVINAKSFANLGLSFSLSDLRLCILPGSCCFGDVMNSLTRSFLTNAQKGVGDERMTYSWWGEGPLMGRDWEQNLFVPFWVPEEPWWLRLGRMSPGCAVTQRCPPWTCLPVLPWPAHYCQCCISFCISFLSMWVLQNPLRRKWVFFERDLKYGHGDISSLKRCQDEMLRRSKNTTLLSLLKIDHLKYCVGL